MPRHLLALLAICIPLSACSGDVEDDDEDLDEDEIEEDPGIELLGSGTNTLDGLTLEVVVDDDLNDPRDLEFHPDEEWQLWVPNAAKDSMTLVDGLDSGDIQTERRSGSSARHFLANPTALAFGDNGTMATAHDEDEVTQSSTPEDFMGPTMWPSDPDRFDGGHSSHMDMLHNSPNGVGVAAAGGNDFWIYDGYHGSLTLYKFNNDHGEGGSDHADGEVFRYLDGELGYEEDVASHIALDLDSGLLYAADTANNRIIVLDTETGEKGSRISPNYDGSKQNQYTGADSWTLVEGADFDLEAPSGLELHDGLLWVSDYATSKIAAFTLDGELVDWVDTEVADGSIMGMAFAPDGSLYMANAADATVMRLSIDGQ